MAPTKGVPVQFTASNSSAPISVGTTLGALSISVVTDPIPIPNPFSWEVGAR